MRYELYSLKCKRCGKSNSPNNEECFSCGGVVCQIRRCPGCQKENPPNAFVCIHCFRVLKTKPQAGILHWHIPGHLSFLIIGLLFSWAAYGVGKQWIEGFQSQIERRMYQEQLASFQGRRAMERIKKKKAELEGTLPVSQES